jgi:phage terminase large subunit-like protein
VASTPIRAMTGFQSCLTMATELDRFQRFAAGVGLELEPFQFEVMEAVLSDRREVVVTQPRGAGKTTLLGCYALWELVKHPQSTIIAAAAARDQAQHLYRAAMRFAKQVPKLRDGLTFTLREIRTPQDGRLLVVSADAEKQMGHDPYLVIVDELGSHTRDDLYVSLRTALIKNPEAKMRIISTMGGSEEAPMPAMRRRVLEEGEVNREFAVLRAETRDSLWLEWSVPEGADIDDMEVVKAANPRKAITTEMLSEHRRVLHESAFRRLHCNQNLPSDDAFISADRWDACAGPIDIPPGSEVVVAVDAGIRRDSTAVVTVRKDENEVFHAGFQVWTPTRQREVRLEDVEEHIIALHERFDVRLVAFDKHLFIGSAQRLEEAGAVMVEWPQTNVFMVPGTQLLHEVIMSGRLRHGGDPVARSHALAAVVAETEMGLRIRKTASRDRIDALVALVMGVAASEKLPAKRISLYESYYQQFGVPA